MNILTTTPSTVKKKLLPTSSETVIDMEDDSDASVPLNDVETALAEVEPESLESAASSSASRSRSAWKIAAGLAAGTGAGLLALSRYASADWWDRTPRPPLRDEISSAQREYYDAINATVRDLHTTHPGQPSINTENTAIFAINTLTRIMALLPGFLEMPAIDAPVNCSLGLLTTPSGTNFGAVHAFLSAPFRRVGPGGSSLPYRCVEPVESDQQQPADITEQEMAMEIELIQHLKSVPGFYVFDDDSSSSNERSKRAAPTAPIVGRNARSLIEQTASKKEYPKNFILIVKEFYQDVAEEKAVKNALPESQDAVFMLVFMSFLSVSQKQHIDTNHFASPYHATYLLLRECWDVSEHIEFGFMEEKLTKYRNEVISKKWSFHKKNHTDLTPADRYFQGRYKEWKEHNLRSNDRVVIHGKNKVRVYTMAELQDGLHLKFIGNDQFFCHFDFDYYGLPDANLNEFIEATKNRDLIAESAAMSLQDILKKQVNTPLYFQLENLVRNIDHGMIRSISSGAETAEDISKIKDAMLEMVASRTAFSEMEQLSIAITEAMIQNDFSANLSGMKVDIDKLMTADYVYRFEDEDGNEKYDIATLAEYLHRETDAENIAIAGRKNVVMQWPVEFPRELKEYLENSASKKAVKIYAGLADDQQASEYRTLMAQKIPSVQSMLETVVDEISEQENLAKGTIKLSDTVVFKYHSVMRPNTGLPSNDFQMPTFYNQSFSVNQILCGEKRVWQAKNLHFSVKEDESGECFFSEKISRPVLTKLESFESQERLTEYFQGIRQDAEIRQVFNDYVQLMEARAPTDRPWQYEFESAPMLRFYAQRDLGVDDDWQHANGGRGVRPNNNNSRVKVFSLRDGSVRDFANFEEIREAISKDEDFRRSLKLHFLTDFDIDREFALSDLSLRSGDVDLFERVIDFEILNVDKIITSQPEATSLQHLEIFQQVSFFVTFAISIGYPVLGMSLGLLLNTGGKVLEAYMVDDNRERRELIVEAAWEFVLQLGISAGSAAVKKGFKAGLRKWLKFHAQRNSIRPISQPQGISHAGEKLPINVKEYMDKFKGHKLVGESIKKPKHKCIGVLEPLGDFMKADGFTDITYRGMLIWRKGTGNQPLNHFVIMGKKSGGTVVFDVTAAQFKKYNRKLHEPLIVTETIWKKKYKYFGKNAVIKYQDFRSVIGAENRFERLPYVIESTEPLENMILL